MIPGMVNSLTVVASKEGVYRGQCAEFCGASHAWMAFEVVALSPEEFDSWRANQARDAVSPSDPFLARGQELFLTAGCGACHRVRGIGADGSLGPDLTHVGSRRRIAAGSFPAHAGTLAGWVAGSQTLKPGNKMPSFDLFTGEELRAISAYLESLR
jgi:cytochrome c oxidase subunit II